MDAQELRLDYFQFYDVGNQEAGYVVALQGQFDKHQEKVRLNYVNMFANPASKNGEPFYDKSAHLTWYDLYDPVPDPTRVVHYVNQFGEQQLVTGRSCALLTPTQKRFPGSSFPESLDHYKVYEVLEPVNKTVKLEDQFGQTETKVYYPAFFAVRSRSGGRGRPSESTTRNPTSSSTRSTRARPRSRS